MNTILATDFTETATRASEIALALAKRAGDRLVVMHVCEPPSTAPQELATDVRVFEQVEREKAHAGLRVCADAARAQGVTTIERLETGDPPQLIAAAAKALDARLIVLGSHGRRRVTRLLLGSVAHETLLLADRPILVARRGGRPVAFEQWAADSRPLRVTLAMDRSPASLAAAAWVRDLRAIGPIDLRLIHVYDPLVEAVRLGFGLGEYVRGDLESALEQDLRALASETLGQTGMTLNLRTGAGRPGEAIARDADEAGADLLVLGTHQRTRVQRIWLGSTAELALRHARVPVVCVPAPSHH
jgi:nucleotide-binding universal stress UspA family protein